MIRAHPAMRAGDPAHHRSSVIGFPSTSRWRSQSEWRVPGPLAALALACASLSGPVSLPAGARPLPARRPRAAARRAPAAPARGIPPM